MKKFISSLCLLFFAGSLFAADIASDFSAANKLYAVGKYTEAAAAYENILKYRCAIPRPALQ